MCWCIETELACFRDFEIKWFTVTLNHLQCSFKKVVYTIVQISGEYPNFIHIFLIELLRHMPGNIMIFWIWFVTQITNMFLIFKIFFSWIVMPKRCYAPNTTRNIELMSVQDRSTYFDSSSLHFRYGSPYHIETSPLICSANQWTGFYMIRTSAMKELNNWKVAFPRFTSREFSPQVQSSAICVICNAWVKQYWV